MKKLSVRFTRSPGDTVAVGELAEEGGRVYFQYAADFLATGLNLSPFRLPFASGLFEHRDHGFGPLPGLFDDSLPDGWGLLLMDRHLQSLALKLTEVSPLDRLAWLGTRTMGALTYHSPVSQDFPGGDAFDLQDLAHHAAGVLAGTASEVLPELVRAGGSPGGARPKVLVGWNAATGAMQSGESDLPAGFEHWIVKLLAKSDPADLGVAEYAYSRMARAAGIDMPPTRLFETPDGQRYFAVQRFDRSGNRRHHVHTFGNLIQANFRVPSADYADLLKVTAVLTRKHPDVLRAFRRMVFNTVAHNRDDHVKNFAFGLDDATGEWSLSPAYDLVYAAGPGGEHTMTIAGEGRNPTLAHIRRIAEQAGLRPRETDTIVHEVESAVAHWPQYAGEAGLSSGAVAETMKGFHSLTLR